MIQLCRALESATPLALAIGNFDGVHLGHRAILDATCRVAATHGLKPAALSFHPLPREFFSRHSGVNATERVVPARLMSVTEKLAALAESGIEQFFMARFNQAFAAQTPAEFIELLKRMQVRWLMVGADFRFGAKRAGDLALLRAEPAFTVVTHDEVRHQGERISSTAIRRALGNGELSLAASMLGQRYRIVGRVTHGKKLGRTLGFPTVNIALTGRKPALGGVFAVQCRLVTRGLEGVAGRDGVILNGVANLGSNPVVSSANRQHLEVFLFDFSGDLYGQRLEVVFIEKIRDEQNFASLDGLVEQMHDDCARAQNILLRMTSDGH